MNLLIGHSLFPSDSFQLDVERERETIKKTLDILEKTAGKRPTGWVTPIYGWSENTLDYLAEAKLAWSECPFEEDAGSAGYHIHPDLALIEIVDPNEANGRTGEVAVIGRSRR